ncbi:MAG: FkbM family methyltransferase [Ginsengibacter sp.]
MRLFIRKLLQKVGYDIVKYHPKYKMGDFDTVNLEGEFKWLKEFDFKTILDIGANEGQFADKMHAIFPKATIYSFEPIPETFAILQRNFENIPQIKPVNLAIGEASGEIIFNKNESTASSSFLEMTGQHTDNFYFAVKTEPINVRVETLVNAMKEESLELPLLIKIDVQGFEEKVINGGIEIIKMADMVFCEVSFVELYKSQSLFDKTFQTFKEMGFKYMGSIEQLRSPETNQILQADAIFVKS